MESPPLPPVPLGVTKQKPPAGLPYVHAVNIGSSDAAALAYHVSQGAAWTTNVITEAKKLEKYARRLPYFWP